MNQETGNRGQETGSKRQSIDFCPLFPVSSLLQEIEWWKSEVQSRYARYSPGCSQRGGGQRKQERIRLERAWAEAVGPQWLPNTRVLALRRNVLEIEVRGAVVLQELSQFHKRRLLEALRKALQGVTVNDLRFCAGSWE